MAEHILGKDAIQVRFLLGAPSGFGEMDIMLVFETSGVGSIPASPAKLTDETEYINGDQYKW
jgi:hypothetical protein